MTIAAGPGRMGLGVDVERERVALLAVGRIGLELGAVRHYHLDAMIVGVEILELLHGNLSPASPSATAEDNPGTSRPSYWKAHAGTSTSCTVACQYARCRTGPLALALGPRHSPRP